MLRFVIAHPHAARVSLIALLAWAVPAPAAAQTAPPLRWGGDAEGGAPYVEADPADLHARHLLGVHEIVAGDPEAGLEQFLEMLRRDRGFDGGLPKQLLIDAFRTLDDEDLVGRYRRKMSSLLLA